LKHFGFSLLLRPCNILQLGSREPYGFMIKRKRIKMSESRLNELIILFFCDQKKQKPSLSVLPQFKNG